MHPAYSVILFTTASGAGYGLIIWLAVAALIGVLPSSAVFTVTSFALALALIAGGLLSSTAHLGRPERAWRAFSQWRTSWLSREGVAAMVTFLPILLLGAALYFSPGNSTGIAFAALASIIGAVITVWCTGMIYASLRTVPSWHHKLVAPGYLVLALATGGLLYVLLTASFVRPPAIIGWLTVVTLLAAAVLKWTYWADTDTAPRQYTAGDATGLGSIGRVRPLDPPHTQANFVMREMGFKVARKHVAKLRPLVLITLTAVPVFFVLLTLLIGGAIAPLWALLAVLSAAIGVFVERWLFFAEAQHVVTLYYGAEAA